MTLDAFQLFGQHAEAFALIPRGSKAPDYKGWTTKTYSTRQARRHAKRDGGNVGYLCGEPSGIVCLDLDANAETFRQQYPRFSDTVGVYRNDAPDRIKLFYRIDGDDLPPNRAADRTDLLSTGKQAIVWGIHPEGARYVVRAAQGGVRRTSTDELARVWEEWTGQPLTPDEGPTDERETPARTTPAPVTNEPHEIAEYVTQRAMREAAPGQRNERGFWLACQLRDAGLSRPDAQVYMLRYQHTVEYLGSHQYTEREARASLRSAYDNPRPEREPLTFSQPSHVDVTIAAAWEWLAAFDGWKNGQTRGNDKKGLAALLAVMDECGKLEVALGVHEWAERAGVTPPTVSAVAERLIDYGIIERTQRHTSTTAAVYRLREGMLEDLTHRVRSRTRNVNDSATLTTTHAYSECKKYQHIYQRWADSDVFLGVNPHEPGSDEYASGERDDLKPLGGTGLEVLVALEHTNGLNIKEVTEITGMCRQTASKKLHALVDLGLARMERDGTSKRFYLMTAEETLSETWEQRLTHAWPRFITYGRQQRRKVENLADRIEWTNRYLPHARPDEARTLRDREPFLWRRLSAEMQRAEEMGVDVGWIAERLQQRLNDRAWMRRRRERNERNTSRVQTRDVTDGGVPPVSVGAAGSAVA